MASKDLGEPHEASRVLRRIDRASGSLPYSHPMPASSSQPTVAIVGGGLAGLAAACALADSGFRVTLFEKRPFLGGRASSYQHPGTGEVVDNCQHVLFRLCTNLIEFYTRIGAAGQIRWFDQMNFIEPGGRISALKSSPLPAPLHTAPAFFAFPFLSLADKLAIARALVPLTLTAPRDTGETFQHWLDRHGQTRNAVARFWQPILVSALSEDLDRISVPAAAQVVRESMKSLPARHMGVPTVPLTDLYTAAGDYIRARGGVLHFRQPVDGFAADSSHVHLEARNQAEDDQNKNQQDSVAPSLSRSLPQAGDRNEGGERDAPRLADFAGRGNLDFDYLVLALPFDALDRVLPDAPESSPLREQISHFENSPITGIHLWFDRQISDLDHAVLLDRTIQWMFHKSNLQPMRAQAANAREGHDFRHAERERKENRALAPEAGSYIELVVSSSKTLIDKSRSEIVDLALAEVREFFPAAREANLLKSTVIKELNATYSPRPGIDAHRPASATAWPRVFLAGDWTATGWPATMEGAVRSGYLAAEAILRAADRPARFISPDLPATGLMRLF
ncbi:MAG TPA: FAD-dependent oxidoreductase [Verrucomicrobiae bacterium]|nr:FAD-dependent oxidoreductase [Verrucomicrobiae bacterium]